MGCRCQRLKSWSKMVKEKVRRYRMMKNDDDPGKGREKHYPLVLLNKELVYEEHEGGLDGYV